MCTCVLTIVVTRSMTVWHSDECVASYGASDSSILTSLKVDYDCSSNKVEHFIAQSLKILIVSF